MRALAAVLGLLLAVAFGAVQAVSSIALRGEGQGGAWPRFVPEALAERVDRIGPTVPLPAALRLVLGREALARGDAGLAALDAAALPPSRDRLALEGGIAEARGDSAAAVRAYLAAGDLSALQAAVDGLVRAGRIPDALALEHAAVDRLAADRTQIDALAQAYFDLGGLEETQAYQFAVGTAVRHDHERAAGDAYAKALALAPFDERYLIAYANQELNLGEIASAERVFERARDADPTSAEPVAGLGDAAFRRGDAAAARAELARARAIDPASAAVARLAKEIGP
jgi:tetratricopeptide (TPR) repeat protein